MQQLKEYLSNNEGMFISSILSTIYDYVEEPDKEKIIMCLKQILLHNQNVYNHLNNEYEKLQTKKDKLQILKPDEIANPTISQEIHTNFEISPDEIKKNLDLEQLYYEVYSCEDIKSLSDVLEKIDISLLPNILLFLNKEINNLILKIRHKIMKNPLDDVNYSQKELIRLQNLFKYIKNYEKTKNKPLIIRKPNIYFLTNNSNTAYFYQTLLENPDASNKIRKSLDKMISGYFIHSKDVKTINRNGHKILEYKDSNGTRILFEDLGNNQYLICDLFFKDKQLSSKIVNYYDINITRYLSFKDKLEQLLNDPNYHIEQAEILGSIYSILEQNQVLALEKGDNNGI